MTRISLVSCSDFCPNLWAVLMSCSFSFIYCSCQPDCRHIRVIIISVVYSVFYGQNHDCITETAMLITIRQPFLSDKPVEQKISLHTSQNKLHLKSKLPVNAKYKYGRKKERIWIESFFIFDVMKNISPRFAKPKTLKCCQNIPCETCDYVLANCDGKNKNHHYIWRKWSTKKPSYRFHSGNTCGIIIHLHAWFSLLSRRYSVNVPKLMIMYMYHAKLDTRLDRGFSWNILESQPRL